MELKLKYSESATATCGVFVESTDMMEWISVASELNTECIKFYPVPGVVPNSVCGALLITNNVEAPLSIHYSNVCSVGGRFYLLEGSEISPKFNKDMLVKRFDNKPHFFHPVYGLMELKELVDWSPFLELEPIQVDLKQPSLGPQFPQKLGEYYIREVEPEEVLKSLIERSVPNRRSLDSPPLTAWEKFKLKALRKVVGKSKGKGEIGSKKGSDIESKNIENQSIKASDKKGWWKRKKEEAEQQLEDLEERNKKELEKLLDMLKNDPDEALKYALPIDRSGYSRGPEVGFSMTKRWGKGIRTSTGSGGSVNIGDDSTSTLRAKYNDLADQYIDKKQWEKASFVYLELLSDPNSAADILAKGSKYEAAAAIYLSKCQNKVLAAECYENGKFYGRAIDLYKEMDWQMNVGDLHAKMGNDVKAKMAYSFELTKMIESKRYFDAGEISKNKLENDELARTHFFEGWEKEGRPNECLNAYLDTYDLQDKKNSISEMHQHDYEGKKAHRFLEVLKSQLHKEIGLKDDVENVVYETVARNANEDKTIVEALKNFNKEELVAKDIMRFKHSKRRRGE